MLGEKRNASLFASAQPPDTEEIPVPAPSESRGARGGTSPAREAHREQSEPAISAEIACDLEPLPVGEMPKPAPPAPLREFPAPKTDLKNAPNRTHNLFFTPESGQDFTSVLRDVQTHISTKYSELINTGDPDAVREQIKRYISKYVQDSRAAVAGMSAAELTDAIYTEMAEFSFLTKYIYGQGIEEININSWDDIEVLYSSGEYTKLEERFDSPEHAINVVRRMLHVSGMILDNASPVMQGSLGKNIRMAVLKTPIVDEDVGVAASIRIVNQLHLTREDFIRSGTATPETLDFLAACLRYGASICFAGATGSGKTTLAGWLLTTLPDTKRIVTIEAGARELSLVKRDEDGRVLNRVIHLLTRESENEHMDVDQTDLIEITLRLHPDVVSIAEMRSSEANAAIEMALAGHTTLSTIHSNSCDSTYRRMVTLCKRGSSIDDATLMSFATEAFPIIVYAKQLENKERKVMEVMECAILPDNSREYRSLFRYNITSNRVEDGKFIIEGRHEKTNEISEGLRRRLLENGMPQDTLETIMKGGTTA